MRAAMCGDNLTRNGQSQPCTSTRAAIVRLEGALGFFDGQAPSTIFDREGDLRATGGDLYPNRAAGRCGFECVVHEIDHNLLQPICIPEHTRHVYVAGKSQTDTQPPRSFCGNVHSRAGRDAEVDLSVMQAQLPSVKARKDQQDHPPDG